MTSIVYNSFIKFPKKSGLLISIYQKNTKNKHIPHTNKLSKIYNQYKTNNNEKNLIEMSQSKPTQVVGIIEGK